MEKRGEEEEEKRAITLHPASIEEPKILREIQVDHVLNDEKLTILRVG
jgi:hypothetical protein